MRFMFLSLLVACSSTPPVVPSAPVVPPLDPPVVAPRRLPPLASARFGVPRAIALPDRADALAYSPDGSELLVMSPRGLHAYDIATGLLNEVIGPDDKLIGACFAFAPDAPQRFVVSTREALVYYDRATKQVIGRWRMPSVDDCSIVWSADGRSFLFADRRHVAHIDIADATPRITDAAPKTQLLPTEEGPRYDRMLTYRDGDRLGALSGQTRVVVNDGRLARRPQPLDGAWRIVAVAGARVIAVNGDDAVWSVALDRPERVRLAVTGGHGRRAANLSPDGRFAYVGFVADHADDRDNAQIVDTTTGKSVDLPPLATKATAWRHDSRQLAVSDHSSHVVFVFDEAGQNAYGRDGGAVRETLIRGGWVLSLTNRVDMWPLTASASPTRSIVAGEPADIVTIDADTELLAVIARTGGYSLIVYALDDGRELWRRPIDQRNDLRVAVGPRIVVTGGTSASLFERDGRVTTVPMNRGRPIAGAFVDAVDGRWIVRGPGGDVPLTTAYETLLAVSGDGNTFVTARTGGLRWLGVRRRGDVLSRYLARNTPESTACVLDHQGVRLACRGLSAVAIFDVASGAQLGVRAELGGDGLTSVGLSDDGRWLATGSTDGTTTLWDLAALPVAPPSPSLASYHAALSPLEQRLFSDGAIFTWRVDGKAPLGDDDVKELGGKAGATSRAVDQTLRCGVDRAGADAGVLHATLRCRGRFAYLFDGASLQTRETDTVIVLPGNGPVPVVRRDPAAGKVDAQDQRDTTTIAGDVTCATRSDDDERFEFCTNGGDFTRIRLRNRAFDVVFTPR